MGGYLPNSVDIYYTDESFTPRTIHIDQGYQQVEIQALKGSMILVRGTEGLIEIGLDSGSVEEITDVRKARYDTSVGAGYLYVGWVK